MEAHGVEWGIAMLGTQRVTAGGRSLVLSGARQQRLLAVLALQANQVVSFSGILDALWDEDPPDTAHRQVHNAVAALRRDLGPVREALATVGRGYRLDIAPETLDFRRFQSCTVRARHAIAAGRPEQACVALAEGLALWHGPALSGLCGRAVEAAAAHLEEERLTAWRCSTGCNWTRAPASRSFPRCAGWSRSFRCATPSASS